MPHPTEDRNFRLPADVRPTSYDAMLRLDLEGRRFEGRARIDLALAAARQEIVLHAVDLDVGAVTLRTAAGALAPAQVERVPASETIVIRFAAPVAPGPAALEI